jgi:hypothetical protein
MRGSICVLFILCFVISGFSQRFNGGVSLGLAATQISGDNLSGFDKAGPCVGGFVEYPLKGDTVCLQLQLYYIQKGSRKAVNPNTGDYTTYRLALNYIEIPFFLKYTFRKKYVVDGGPAMGVLFASSVQNQFGNYPAGDPHNRPFRPLELSFSLGIGYRLTNKLLLSIRNSNSLLPVRKHYGGGTFRLNRGQYNSVMLFSAAYTITSKH